MSEVDNDKRTNSLQAEGSLSTLPDRGAKWVSSISGGVAGAIITALLLVIPVINTWLANTKEIQLQQVKNNTEQIEYITKRMVDSDRERDLYKTEMLVCQKQLRECKR